MEPEHFGIEQKVARTAHRAVLLPVSPASRTAMRPVTGLAIEELTFTLGKLREEFGADDSFVRRLFEERSPAELARALVESSALANVEERKRLFDGGRDAIKVSIDPMIAAMGATIDPFARSVREDYETNVEAPFANGGEKIARALFALRGFGMGTLRLSFGQACPRQHP